MEAHKEEAETLFNDLLGQVAILNDSEMFTKIYGFTMEEYLQHRKEFAELCLTQAAHIEKVVKKSGKVKVGGGALSIGSGAAGLAGVFLAPATGGLSLVLTAGAAAGGVASAATGFAAGIMKKKKVKRDEDVIKEALAAFDEEEQVVVDLLQQLNQNFGKLHNLMKKDESVLELIVGYATGIKDFTKNIDYKDIDKFKSLDAVVVAKSFAKFVHADFKALKISKNVSSPALRLFRGTGLAVGSTSAKLLSGSLAVVGIGVGVHSIVEGAKDIEGSKVANQYREFAETYRKETIEIKKQLYQLESMTK